MEQISGTNKYKYILSKQVTEFWSYEPKTQNWGDHGLMASDISGPTTWLGTKEKIASLQKLVTTAVSLTNRYEWEWKWKSTLKLAHFTKQNGQEKSSVTARHIANRIHNVICKVKVMMYKYNRSGKQMKIYTWVWNKIGTILSYLQSYGICCYSSCNWKLHFVSSTYAMNVVV